MVTETTTASATRTNSPSAQLGYTLYAEVIRTLRIPALVIPSLIFPSLFFILFGIPNQQYNIASANAATFLMVSYGCYAAMSTSFLSFGIGTASERGMGWNRLLRASPINPLYLFVAKVVSVVIVILLSVLLLYVVSIVLGKVSLPLDEWFGVTGMLLVGVIPFVVLGLVLGYSAGPNSAPAIGNLVFIPLSFFSGILIPVQFLPDFARGFAKFTPSYHVGQLAWHVIGAGDSTSIGVHLLWVVGYTIIFVWLAFIAYRREERRTFG